MEYNRESRNEPTHVWSINDERTKNIHLGKESLFKNGKTGQVKEYNMYTIFQHTQNGLKI